MIETGSYSDDEHRASQETVLLAAVGTAPAVITETLYALACESPPCIPDRLIVVTTVAGRQLLQEQLLSASPQGRMSPWEECNAWICDTVSGAHPVRFGDTGDDIRVITATSATGRSHELNDIRSQEESAATADFLMEVVRGLTSHPDISLVVSISGGRKTIGTLLYGCMTLLGRRQDRITHVLVNSPFDRPTSPPFFFPAQHAQRLMTSEGNSIDSDGAGVVLADLPFVPVGEMLADSGKSPGSFSSLVERSTASVSGLLPDRFTLQLSGPRLRCELIFALSSAADSSQATTVRTSPREHLVLLFLASFVVSEKAIPFHSYESLVQPLSQFRAEMAAKHSWVREKVTELDTQDITRLISDLRRTFQEAGPAGKLIALRLPCRGRISFDLPPQCIRFIN